MSSSADNANLVQTFGPDGLPETTLRPVWDAGRVAAVSACASVVRVVAVGTVFAAEVIPPGGAGASGYHSAASSSAQARASSLHTPA